MRTHLGLLTVSLTGMLTTGIAAQSTRVVPLATTAVEGSTSGVYPFGYTNPRCQQVWLGSAITSGTAVLNGIRYRMDTTSTRSGVPGRKYQNVKFTLSATTAGPQSLSNTFAANITSTPTTVVSGNWDLPTQPAPTVSPAPFNIEMNWAGPFLFSATSGNLLLDITLPGAVGKSSYFVDAEYSTGMDGATAPIGTNGAFSSPEKVSLAANAGDLKPGGTLSLTCGLFQNSYAGSLIVGLSDQTWNSISLPLDLGLIGATGNNLYTSLDIQVPFSTTPVRGGHRSMLTGSIPSTPVHNGFRFYAQGLYLDAAANAAGLVTTAGLTLRLQNPGVGPVTNQVGNYDATATTGTSPWGTARFGGPVVQFVGVF